MDRRNGGARRLREKGGNPMKYIPMAKRSKRAQKEHFDKQRGSWNGVAPVTRVMPNKRAYERNRAKQADRSLQTAED